MTVLAVNLHRARKSMAHLCIDAELDQRDSVLFGVRKDGVLG